MDIEKIIKIVSQVKSNKINNKKSTESIVDPNKENAIRIAKIMINIDHCIRNLED